MLEMKEGKAVSDEPAVAAAAVKEWTIMVYMAGDNDLSEDMIKRLIELRTIFDTNSGTIKANRIGLGVYFDGDNPMMTTKRYNFTTSHG